MTENFVITIVYLLIGVLLSRVFKLPAKTFNYLNLYAIYIALPAMILLKIPELSFSPDLFVLAAMPWIMIVISVIAVLGMAKFFSWDRNIIGSMLLLIPLGNTSFLGIPMVSAFFGESAIPYAVLYDQLGSFLALATYGTVILALFSADSAPDVKTVLKKVITFPPFLALIAAFLLKFFTYPVFIKSSLSLISVTLVPVVMIAVGFQLTVRLDKKIINPLTAGLVFKLIIAPVAAILVCAIWGIEGVEAKVAVFEAGMPPMVSAGAIAIMANLAPSLSAALVGFGILISFITLPLLYSIL